MQIECNARSYASADEMRADYSNRRKRLYGNRWAGASPPVVDPVAIEPAPLPVETIEPASQDEPGAVRGYDYKFYFVGSPSSTVIRAIKAAACAEFGITLAEMDSHRREQRLVTPRHIAITLSKRLTGRSLPDIGRRFGGRDHTTVLHSIGRMRRYVDAVAPTMAVDASPLDWVRALRVAIQG